jgi:transcriptional regulator PpsR
VINTPTGPSDTPDLGALSDLAPQLAQTFVSVASDIALVIDAGGVIRNVAVGAEPITPSTAEWVGRPWAETVTGDTRRKVEQLLSEVQAHGVTRRREVNHPTIGGQNIPVAYAAIRLGRGGPVLAVGRDLRAVAAIQQRFVEAQQAMERDYWKQRQSETRYRLLFQVATDAVLVVDAQTMCTIEANRAAGTLFGRPSQDLIGLSASIAIAPHARAGVDELLSMARATGRPAEIRTVVAGLDLASAAIDMSATPFRAGDAMLLLVRARAVESANEARGTSSRLIDFVERTPDAVVITDSAGRVQMANPAFVALCQGSGDRALAGDPQVIGRGLADSLGDPQRTLAAILAEARRQGYAERRQAMVGRDEALRANVEVSAALLAEGDQECIGLTLRRVDDRLAMLPPAVGELAAAIDQLAAQVGLATLPELLQEASDLAERHLIDAALARSNGDPLRTAALLGIGTDDLWLRLRHHGIDTGTHRGDKPPPLLN